MKKKIFIFFGIILLIILLLFLGYFLYEKSLENTIDNTTFQIKNNNDVEVYSDVKVSSFIYDLKGTLIDDFSIDTKELGEKEITFSYKNEKGHRRRGNFNINVVDTTNPVILLKNSYSVVEGYNKNLTDVIMSFDNYDSKPNREIIGEYDLNKPGTYNLEYKITDSSGNVTSKQFKLNVLKKSKSDTQVKKTYTYFKDVVSNYKNNDTSIGIDVSKWQGNIDFNKLKENGVEFVIIRIGTQDGFDGEILEDVYFKNNIEKAKEAGLDVGLYFYSYAKTKEEVLEQAKWIIKKLDGMKLELPIAYDWESWNSFNKTNLSLYEFNELAYTFMNYIEKNGYKSMLYGSKYYLINVFSTDKTVWLAHYTNKTDYDGKYYIWQMCNDGIVSGINGYVDIDILYKNEED